MRMIRAAGGLTLVQEPETAQHASMVRSAIEAGVVDQVLPIQEMVEKLMAFVEHPYLSSGESEQTEEGERNLHAITAILKERENFNLALYKPTTVQRRIIRRMGLLNIQAYPDYLELLKKDKKERQLLTRDLLINVTDFFRNPEAFELVEKKALTPLIKSMEEEDFRLWVCGCASGEEAYSLTILLNELAHRYKKSLAIRVYATDIDEEAIAIARKGIYPDSIAAEMPEKYLKKYFHKIDGDHYQIDRKIRDQIAFAVQNVVTDPPFSQMHFISCRNLLIYLKKEVQDKVLNAFYFALKPDAFLFLGTAETAGIQTSHYKTISKKWRLYTKLSGRDNSFLPYANYEGRKFSPPSSKYYRSRGEVKIPSRAENLRRDLLLSILPPTLLVDKHDNIVYNHGNLHPFMQTAEGEPNLNVYKNVVPELRSRLRSAVFKLKKTRGGC